MAQMRWRVSRDGTRLAYKFFPHQNTYRPINLKTIKQALQN